MNKKLLIVAIVIVSFITIAIIYFLDKEPMEDVGNEEPNEMYDYTKDVKEKEKDDEENIKKDDTKEEQEEKPEDKELVLDDLDDIDLLDLDESERSHVVENDFSLTDHFSKEEIEQARKTGEQFVKHYHEFDGNAPLDHLNKTIEFATGELQEYLKKLSNSGEGAIRPTPDFFNRKITNVEIRDSSYATENTIVLEYRVESEFQNAKGNKTSDDDLTIYLLEFKLDNDEYKVVNFTTNLPT